MKREEKRGERRERKNPKPYVFHLVHHHFLRGRVAALVVDALLPDRGAVRGAREPLARVIQPGVEAVVV